MTANVAPADRAHSRDGGGCAPEVLAAARALDRLTERDTGRVWVRGGAEAPTYQRNAEVWRWAAESLAALDAAEPAARLIEERADELAAALGALSISHVETWSDGVLPPRLKVDVDGYRAKAAAVLQLRERMGRKLRSVGESAEPPWALFDECLSEHARPLLTPRTDAASEESRREALRRSTPPLAGRHADPAVKRARDALLEWLRTWNGPDRLVWLAGETTLMAAGGGSFQVTRRDWVAMMIAQAVGDALHLPPPEHSLAVAKLEAVATSRRVDRALGTPKRSKQYAASEALAEILGPGWSAGTIDKL